MHPKIRKASEYIDTVKARLAKLELQRNRLIVQMGDVEMDIRLAKSDLEQAHKWLKEQVDSSE